MIQIPNLPGLVSQAVVREWEYRGLGFPSTEARENVHDEVWSILQKANSTKKIRSIYSYARVVIDRCARHASRTEKRQHLVRERAGREISLQMSQVSVEDIVDARLTLDKVHDAFDRLDVMHKRILAGVLAGFTTRQISQFTGLSESGVNKRIRIGRERLQSAVKEDYYGTHTDELLAPNVVDNGVPLPHRGIH